MIRVYPDGLMQESQSGWVPLHVACWRGAYPEVIALLLRCCPASAWVMDDRGRLPLHKACSFADTVPVETLRYLLLGMLGDGSRNGVEMGVLRRDQCGDTPLTLLMHSYREALQEMRQGMLYLNDDESEVEALRTKLDNYYLKMRYLVVAACKRKINFEILSNHACVLNCAIDVEEVSSPEFIDLILIKSSSLPKEELYALDEEGNSPAHKLSSKMLVYDKDQMRFSRIDRKERVLCEKRSITILTFDHPEAFHVNDKNGRTCLDLAIESEKLINHGIREIIACCPSALERRSVDIRLYPRILECIGQGNELSAVRAIYGILRTQPNLVSGVPFLSAKPTRRPFFSLFRCSKS